MHPDIKVNIIFWIGDNLHKKNRKGKKKAKRDFSDEVIYG